MVLVADLDQLCVSCFEALTSWVSWLIVDFIIDCSLFHYQLRCLARNSTGCVVTGQFCHFRCSTNNKKEQHSILTLKH